MKIFVRKFVPETDAGLIRFSGNTTTVRTGDDEMMVDCTKDDFYSRFVPEGFWLAIGDDRVIGAILFARTEERGVPEIGIYGLSVDPTHRFRGIGGLLMHKADLFADTTGIKRLVAWIDPNNAGALVLFNKCRFRKTDAASDTITMVKKR